MCVCVYTEDYLAHHAFQVPSSRQSLGSQINNFKIPLACWFPPVLQNLTVRCIHTTFWCGNKSCGARDSMGYIILLMLILTRCWSFEVSFLIFSINCLCTFKIYALDCYLVIFLLIYLSTSPTTYPSICTSM